MKEILWLLLGIIAACPFLWYAKNSEKEKAVLASSLIIVASIYPIFALIWGDLRWLGIEFLGVLGYGIFYILGKKINLRWVGVGWLLHPIWDIALHLFGEGAQIAPTWCA